VADALHRERVRQHMMVGVESLCILREEASCAGKQRTG
jgi:hypothetical protein